MAVLLEEFVYLQLNPKELEELGLCQILLYLIKVTADNLSYDILAIIVIITITELYFPWSLCKNCKKPEQS